MLTSASQNPPKREHNERNRSRTAPSTIGHREDVRGRTQETADPSGIHLEHATTAQDLSHEANRTNRLVAEHGDTHATLTARSSLRLTTYVSAPAETI